MHHSDEILPLLGENTAAQANLIVPLYNTTHTAIPDEQIDSSDLMLYMPEEQTDATTATPPDLFSDLVAAISKGDLTKIARCLEEGVDVNSTDLTSRIGMTALELVFPLILSNKLDILKLLVDAGADVNVQNELHKNTPLMFAVACNSTNLIKLFVEAGAKLDLKNKYGQTTLMVGLSKRYDFNYGDFSVGFPVNAIDAINLLLELGAKVNDTNMHGSTALHKAAEIRNPYIATLLLENGADITAKDCYGNTPLMVAARNPYHTGTIDTLVKSGSPLDLQDNYGRTALMLAAEAGQMDAILVLIGYGAVLDLQDNYGKTAVMLAAEAGRIDVAMILVMKGKGPNPLDVNGERRIVSPNYIENLKLRFFNFFGL